MQGVCGQLCCAHRHPAGAGLEANPGCSSTRRCRCRLPRPCLTETIDVARRRGNQSSARQLHATLTSLGRIEHPTDADLVRAAELLEVSERNPGPPAGSFPATLSLGDALILAITERLGFMVLTRDDYWRWMVDQGLLHITVRVP